VDLVAHYLGFLLSISDENSESLDEETLHHLVLHSVDARALFERAIGTFPPDRARPLWERWARHEYQYGGLVAARKHGQSLP
jgi:cleavage stimulation factor subunit 3